VPAADDEHDAGGQLALDAGRVFALTDGVFAIAMTLLVLDLAIPEGLEGDKVNEAIAGLSANYLALFISFVVIAAFWIGHRYKFRGVTVIEGPLLWLNFAFLGSITLMPFTTRLIAEYGDLELPTAIYAANVAIAALVVTAIFIVVTDDDRKLPQLLLDSGTFDTALVFGLSIPVAWLSATGAKWMWAILILTGPVLGRARGRRSPSRGTADR